MLDVAIIGGGLCGLALAHSLQARRVDWALFEARPRLGGRVLTAHSEGPRAGLPLDLGPTWYWPATQPSITRLVDDLGLASMAQPDDGQLLLLDDPNRAPRVIAFDPALGGPRAEAPPRPGALHGGARRLVGGMAALTDALAARLHPGALHRAHALQALHDRGDHVELQLLHEGEHRRVRARRVVLALPPRLAAGLRFDPVLPAPLRQALAATPTWMASAAKAAIPCGQAVWRHAPAAGNAWVTHAQAVLAEVFDAGPPGGATAAGAAGPARGALAGFVALGAAQRPAYRRGLPLLVESQLTMLFGAACAPGTPLLQDWADEPFTCSPANRLDDGAGGPHPVYGDEALHAPQWQGRLWLGGSETARQGGGYLEGALGAAARLRRQLDAVAPAGAALQR